MRSACVAIWFPQGDSLAVPEAFTSLVDLAVGEGRYRVWKEALPNGYQPHPGELRSARIGVTGSWGVIDLKHHRAPGQVAMKLAAARPDRLVLLHLGPEIDDVPGLGRVHRKGPGNSETLKLYLGDTPWLKIGDAADDDVKYPVPNLVAERLPIVMGKLRPGLGDKANGLESFLESALRTQSLNPSDVLTFLGFPPLGSVAAQERFWLKKDSPLILNSP